MSDETVFRFEDAAVTDQQIKKGDVTIMLDSVKTVEFKSEWSYRLFCASVVFIILYVTGFVVLGLFLGKPIADPKTTASTGTLLVWVIVYLVGLVFGFHALKVLRRGWASVRVQTHEKWHTIGTGYRQEMLALKNAIDNTAAASRRRQASNG